MLLAQFLDKLRLPGRKHLSLPMGDAYLFGHQCSRLAVVTGEQIDFHAIVLKLSHRLFGSQSDPVGDADYRQNPFRIAKPDKRHRIGREFLSAFEKRLGDFDSVFCH